MEKTYYNQYQTMMKINEKINCSSMSFWLYQQKGLFKPDKMEVRGTRKFPKYSQETIDKIVTIIREKRTQKSAKGVQINANKLEDIKS